MLRRDVSYQEQKLLAACLCVHLDQYMTVDRDLANTCLTFWFHEMDEVVSGHVTKTYRGYRRTSPHILNFDTRWS